MLALAAFANPAAAQNYPTRSIRLIIPFARAAATTWSGASSPTSLARSSASSVRRQSPWRRRRGRQRPCGQGGARRLHTADRLDSACRRSVALSRVVRSGEEFRAGQHHRHRNQRAQCQSEGSNPLGQGVLAFAKEKPGVLNYARRASAASSISAANCSSSWPA